jgi:hypothetical protein
MKVLAIDISGTHVKPLMTGQTEHGTQRIRFQPRIDSSDVAGGCPQAREGLEVSITLALEMGSSLHMVTRGTFCVSAVR